MTQLNQSIQLVEIQSTVSDWVYREILANPIVSLTFFIVLTLILIYIQCFRPKNTISSKMKKTSSTLDIMRSQYAERIKAAKNHSEDRTSEIKTEIMAQIAEENSRIKQMRKNHRKTAEEKRQQYQQRKSRLRSKANLNKYLMQDRRPKKSPENRPQESASKYQSQKVAKKEVYEKLRKQTLETKRFVEDEYQNDLSNSQQLFKPQQKKNPPQVKTNNIKGSQLKETGTFNFKSSQATTNLFPSVQNQFTSGEKIVENKPQQKKIPQKKIETSTNSLFGNNQPLTGSFGNTGSLFGNLTLNQNEKDLFNRPENKQENILTPSLEANKKQSQPKPSQPIFNKNQQKLPKLPSDEPQKSKPNNIASQFKPAPPKPSQKLTSEQFLESYIKYTQNLKEEGSINSKIENISGARSSPVETLAQIKALLKTIDKNDDRQITTFGLKLFETILFKFINNSNVKSGISRIPPKSRTEQCQKNAINCYVLACNMMRLMPGYKKVWVIVFGKTLKMLQFLYKRKTDLENYHKLELIQQGYVKQYKEIHSKYISRIDFLIYFLLGLTSFDPLLIIRTLQAKDPKIQPVRMELEEWGNTWSYVQFWNLCQVIYANNHQSYFKPIFYMNLLYILYPRIYEYKKTNGAAFGQEYTLLTRTIEKAKKYLSGFEKMKQMKILSECEENQRMNYVYDGDDFVDSIKLLSNRITEKERELKLKFNEYQEKANIFYYFSKQK